MSSDRDARLLLGPVASCVFAAGLLIFPIFVPGYDQVRQTVSEVGEVTSPMRWPFAAMLWIVGACLAVFAWALRRTSISEKYNTLASYLVGYMAIVCAGIGVFAYPHSLHNIFGLSELFAYQAPAAFALEWRTNVQERALVVFSWVMWISLLISVALNMVQIIHHGALWDEIKPRYGLVQRSLFACFFIWIAGVGFSLWRRGRDDGA